MLGLEQRKGLAHGAGAYAELTRQVAFIGNGGTGFPLPAGDALGQRIAQLQIDRSRRELHA
jgi:hypothetical protein